MLPKTAKDTKDSQSRLDFFLMKGPLHHISNAVESGIEGVRNDNRVQIIGLTF